MKLPAIVLMLHGLIEARVLVSCRSTELPSKKSGGTQDKQSHERKDRKLAAIQFESVRIGISLDNVSNVSVGLFPNGDGETVQWARRAFYPQPVR